MSIVDREEWLEAYRVEGQGFKDRDVFSIVVPPPNVKILGTTTVCDYKKDSGVFQKRYACAYEGINRSKELITCPLTYTLLQ
jgi:hypothetical protein